MRHPHRGFGLVDVLAAGAARAQRVDSKIGIVDGDVDLLSLGQDGDGRRRGVDAAGRLRIGHALDAVHAGFVFQLGEGAAAADFGDDFLIAAHRAFARGHDFDLPALIGGITLVHAKQIAGEQSRFVAAGAGADFKNDVAVVHRIFGQERQPQFLFERRAPRLKLAAFPLRRWSAFRRRLRGPRSGSSDRRVRAARRDRN